VEADRPRRALHVAVVVQNVAVEIDMRPRAEAAALAAAGFTVTIVGGTAYHEAARNAVAPDVRVELFELPQQAGGFAGQVRELGLAFARTWKALRAVARELPIDVLHASNPPDNLWLLPRILQRVQGFAPALVFDQHDVAPVLLEQKYGGGGAMRPAAALARRFERESFGRASIVVFANPEYSARARAEGLLPPRWTIVENTWSLPESKWEEDWQRSARHLVAYVGAINQQDCVQHLVDAIALLPQREHVRVVAAGAGDGLAPAQGRAEELGMTSVFDWLGSVRERGRLASLVRAADVCVAPEIDSEFNRLASFVKIPEYMSVGAAIAAHRLPQNVRLCGETVEYADDMTPAGLAGAIDRLLTDPARRIKLGKAAQRRFDDSLRWETRGAVNLVRAYMETFRTEPKLS
jgi:glycosyltransferase involved in cell wall biosynthesis